MHKSAYALALNYEIFGQGHLGQSLGRVSGSNVPNANLVPFTKTETEIGLDARFFDSRLKLDLAYYKNNTKNDIVNVSTSQTSGFTGASANLGEIENKGVEFLVTGTPVQTENFNWTSSINGSYNDGVVISTNDSDSNINLQEPRTRNVRITQIVGEAFGTIVGVSYDRDENGNIRYQINSDGVPLAVEGERKILGEGVPPWNFGWTNTFSYKNLSLSVLIDGKFGAQIFSGTNTVTTANGLNARTLQGRENGLEVSGINADTGQAFTTTVNPEDLQTYWGRISNIAEEFVEDADFIKLRQLSLGYSFPKKLLENTFITDVNISFIASNLFYISNNLDNITPESAYNVSNSQGLEYFGLPNTRTYGFNFNLKF